MNIIKMNALTAFLSLVLVNVINAQLCEKGYGYTTNPSNTDWSTTVNINGVSKALYDKEFKKNKFDWKTPNSSTPYSYFQYPSFNNVGYLQSPFFAISSSTSYNSAIAYKTDANWYPDFYPEDGWELIKQDLGYFNNDNTGAIKHAANCTNNCDFDANGQSTENAAYAKFRYIILYNKFTGMLRVLVNYPFSNIITSQYISVTLTFKDYSTSAVHDYHINGLYSFADPIANPMNQKTAVTNMKTLSVYPGPVDFAYADFQMAYDPCICSAVKPSAIHLDFQLVQQSNVKLFGATVQGSDAADYLTSVWSSTDGAQDVKGGVLTYKTNQALEDGLKGLTTSEGITTAETIKQNLESVNTLLEGSSSILALAGQEEAAAPLEAASKVTGFLSSKIGSESNSPQVALSAFTGVINTSSIPNVDGVDISMPGSPQAINITDEYPLNGGERYPMYNEVLGTFALLKVPTISYYSNSVEREKTCILNVTAWKTAGSRKVSFQLPINSSNISYAFNPVLNVKKNNYKIKAAIVIKRNYYRWDLTIYPSFRNLDLYDDPKSDNDYNTASYITPFVPIEDLASVIPTFDYAKYQGPQFNDCNANKFPDPNYIDQFEAQLKLQVFMEFDQLNKKGDKNQSVLLLTYPLSLTNSSNDVSSGSINSNSPYNSGDIPSMLNMTTYNFTSSQNVYAWDNINITGTLTDNSQINLIAGEQIAMTGESSLSGEFTAQIGAPISTTLASASSTDLASFCGKTNSDITFIYNADTPLLNARIDQTNQASLVNLSTNGSITLSAHPNPLWTSTTFYYKVPEKGSVKLYLTNGLGQKVAEVLSNATHEAGEFEIEYTNSSLPSGMYLVVLEAEGVKETIRLAVVR